MFEVSEIISARWDQGPKETELQRFNMQPEPYSSLEITESVKWNKMNW